jgi:UDP-N-acetylglucosamine 2-epimerase (non-hydrolysing)
MSAPGGATVDYPPVRILVLIGTRPEAIKMLPLVLALQECAWFEPVVVTTGQHRDLVDPILELGGIEPEFDLDVGRPGLGLNDLVAAVVTRLDAFCRERFGAAGSLVATRDVIRDEGFPAAALVHGDTSSALAAALAAFNLRIPVVHVEAGLRTRVTLTPFPEELNRQLIARIASLHLAPTSANEENLIRERVSADQVFVTGNTGIDALRFAAGLDVEIDDPRVAAAVAGGGPVVTVTAHRRENWHGGLTAIGEAVATLATTHRDVEFVLPLHPNPLVREELRGPLEGYGNVILCDPLSYAPFARLLAGSVLVITDSGGIQEEAPALDVPVLVTRDSTERGEGVEAGTLRLVGTDPGRIVEEASRLLSDPGERALMAASQNPYGDGRASARIVSALEWLAGVGPPPVPFGSGFSRRVVLSAAGYRGGLFSPHIGEDRGVQPDRSEEHDRWVAG